MKLSKSIRSRACAAIAPTGRARELRTALPALCLGLVLAAGPAAAGGIVTFVDEEGVTHFTNRPHEPRYRNMVKVKVQAVPLPRPPLDWRYDGLIGLVARQHDLPPALVKAVIAAESAFDPQAVSRKGAQGLMQLMPQTSAELGVADPLRAEENVEGGTRYLRSMLDRYGQLPLALAAYNAGPTAVDRYGGVPPYRETRDYVRRVMTYYRGYYGDFGR